MSLTRDSPTVGYPPQPSRLKTIASHPIIIIKKEDQDIRPQSPQLSLARPTHPVPTPTPTPPPQMRRTNKSPKPKERILKVQTPQEQVNYPCHESLSEFHHQQLAAMELYPGDGVSRYTRRIPFKGSKGAFFETTGRNQFDVYEYRFTAPNIFGEKKQWWIMWDYYNGLVRVHDFFDCCKPGKTEPGNALKDKVNPGLVALCPNITGGNLHAQGYWFPFEAARALASRFCYKIRYALTIIFGEDFPSICLPEDHEDFGKYNIDPAIIARCQQRADDQRRLESERRRRSGETTLTPSTPRYVTPADTTPADTTPARSTFQTASPEMGSMSREQGKFFDPVRDGYTNGNSNQRPDTSPWSNSGHDISSPPSQGQPMVSSVPSYYPCGAPPENSISRIVNSRHHPYSNYAVGKATPTPTRSPVSIGGFLRSPAESLASNDPHKHAYHHHHIQSGASMSPEFSTPAYPPLVRSMPGSDVEYMFVPTASAPQRRESPISRYKADQEHGSKRRRVSGQLSPTPEYYGQRDEQANDGETGCGHNTDGRSIMSRAMVPYARWSSGKSPERDAMEEAAIGLLDLRRKDTELERHYRSRST